MLTVLLLAVAIALMVILPLILFYFSPKIAALENERRELRGDLYCIYSQSRENAVIKAKAWRPPVSFYSEYGKSLYHNKDIIARVEALKMKQDISDVVENFGIKEPKVQAVPDPLPHPFLPSMKNPPPPPPAKIPGTVTADELSLRDLLYRRDVVISKMRRLVDMMTAYSANGIAINSAQADFDELERREREISDMIISAREKPKDKYPRGGIVSGKDLFDALHSDKPETIVPPNKIKEILSESIGIKPGELVMNALNEKYTFAQVARGWVAPGEYTKRSGGWIFAAVSPAYKIMIPRTTGKTITDISTAVGNYGQTN